VNEQLRHLAGRIRIELSELERLVQRTEEGWRRAQRSADDHYLDGVALNLHGFYNGLERIFERIAAVVDGSKPAGDAWHQALLHQMNQDYNHERTTVRSTGRGDRSNPPPL
jgi:hypothetical protein